MQTSELITLNRACEAIGIPSGVREVLPQGTTVRIMQFLGSGYTIVDDRGYMLRIDARDADAMGLAEAGATSAAPAGAFNEEMVWDQLRTVYDPEIPVNIVDLGLVYACTIEDIETGGKRISVEMSMTAPGCGMGERAEVRCGGQTSPASGGQGRSRGGGIRSALESQPHVGGNQAETRFRP